MAHDRQDLQVPPVIVVDNGDANSGVNTTESPAGNGTNGEHLVDAEDFKNMRLAIGTLERSILEISLSDNLTGTRHIDIRLRQKNRPQSGDGVAAVAPGHAVEPGNEAHQEQVPPPDSAAAAQSRLKITVAADETDPKPDEDKEYLNQMRGWLMTVATLFVGIAFQAAIQPPQWVLGTLLLQAARPEDGSNTWPASAPAAAPSPDAAHQRATDNWTGKDYRATLYLASNGAAFATAMSLLLALVLLPGTSAARRVTNLVKIAMPSLFFAVGLTFVVAMSTNWSMTAALFILLVGAANILIATLLGKLDGCAGRLLRLFRRC